MTKQKIPAVPGIPLASLDNIADPNTRDVLRALVNAHQVRNGSAGTGDERFVTAREVGLVKGHSGGIGGRFSGNIGNPSPGDASEVLLPPSVIGRVITDLQSQVLESPLFKDLGERIDLIDKPGGIFDRLGESEIVIKREIEERKTADEAEIKLREALGVRVGTAEGAILTEVQARTNADSAIVKSVNTQFTAVDRSLGLVQQSVTTVSNAVSSVAQTVTQVQASVGDNAVAIKQEAEARANADGTINAKYTVKIDNNGYVTGYGLMSTSNNSKPFSEFIVRADRFAIASPAGPGIRPAVPFIVTTTPSQAGGETAPPGVYIQDAFIMNGSITNAKIGDLEVDTLKIAGDSVTVGTFVQGGGSTVPASSGTIRTRTLLTRTLNLGDGYNTGVIAIAVVSIAAPVNATYGLRILVNGNVVSDIRSGIQGGYTEMATTVGFEGNSGQTCTVSLVAYNVEEGPGSNVSLSINNSRMAIFGGKR